MQYCDETVGGRIPLIATQEEYEEVVSYLSGLEYMRFVWLSVRYSDHKQSWVDVYTGEPVKHLQLFGATTSEPAGKTAIQADRQSYILVENLDERYAQKERVHCMCSLHPIKLRGLPQCLDIERFFMPIEVNSGDNAVMFKGYGKYEIHPNLDNKGKPGQIEITSSTLVRSPESDVSKMFGKRKWTVQGRYPLCGSYPTGETIELMLTKCVNGNFTCNDGQCVSIEQRCDNVLDCRDESDEEECEILDLRKNYNKYSAPITKVTVDITLEDIEAIRESHSEIDLTVSISLNWTDARATYWNLKGNQVQDTLQKQHIEKLWIPKLIFQNSKQKHDTTSSLSESKVFVSREGNRSKVSNKVVDEVATYKGKENPIVMEYLTTLSLKCTFNFILFPFDTQVMLLFHKHTTNHKSTHKYVNSIPFLAQVCFLQIEVDEEDQENVKVLAGLLEMDSVRELKKHFVVEDSPTFVQTSL